VVEGSDPKVAAANRKMNCRNKNQLQIPTHSLAPLSGRARARVGRVPAFAALTLALALSGCTYLSYVGPNGERFARGAVGANASIASLSLEYLTNGLRRVELRGYQSETTQALGVVTEAAVRAAIQGAK
jgi:hypothetical protein